MSTTEPQVVDSEEFIPILDYEFTGDSYTVGRKRLCVEGYRIKSSIYHAAQHAQVSRKTVYNWLNNDSQFAKAMEDSKEDSVDVMETSAYEDALGRDGKRGDPILKMFWLKAHRAKFRDRIAVDVQAIQREVREHINALMSQRQPIVATGSNDGALQLPAPTTEFIPADTSRPTSHASQVDKTLDIVELARQRNGSQ